ncbi:UDP-glucose:(heptosyl)LPS alpha-1,3-glucosyltransferase [Paramicrobacterium humi]|uniref:UDP-glucose:(Heptosyl)LPS alpha-1,3-glucosyltransferase n=1 Tax=Paramicrobacterium humi TaxID=640635 RepID=A0A1H4MLK6_9MICO|nr:UDP-glucose:(heptosyl)LPS alpha-1,3-glucosyltransferase [Microbacterium humi]
MTLVSTAVDPAPQPPLVWNRVTMPRVPDFAVPLVYPSRATRSLSDFPFDIRHNQGGCALRIQDVITAHSCHRAWWEMKFRHGETSRALLNPQHHAILRTERANYRPGSFARVIAVSEGVGREVSSLYGVPADQIRVIPNAVDIRKFQPSDSHVRRKRVRELHGFRSGDVILLWVGKEFRRKGLAPLIEALPMLPERVKLLVVGGGDTKPFRDDAGQRGVLERVVFAGHSAQVEDYFLAGDVFVFPTLYEAFALVTLEAAAAGLPIVTTKVNGTEDFVAEGENGFFIERNSTSIAHVLNALVKNAELRQRVGEEARRRVASYTWESVARRTRGVYAEVVQERDRRRGVRRRFN